MKCNNSTRFLAIVYLSAYADASNFGIKRNSLQTPRSTPQTSSITALDLPRGGDSSPTKRALGSLDLALAGAVATMIGDAMMHPIDCIKTLQQSDEGYGLNMIQVGKQIFQSDGLKGFYSGLGTYVLSDGGAGALKFAAYEALKSYTTSNIPEEYQGSALFGCAALAFIASSIIIVPGELLKQRLQMGQISSVYEGITNILKNEGFLGLFKGYSGVCLRDIPYTMLELGIYDNLKNAFLKHNKTHGQIDGNNAKITIIAAAIAGGFTGFLTAPLDTIKTKIMVDDAGIYNGFVDATRKVIAQHGISSLFQGSAARVFWIMPFTAVYLPLYEVFKRKLELMVPKVL
eukprot:CAMPEP_0194353648 /NCGR_PEP_ID=MMETSP0174-20130528/1940_1 /TAXON_ID=216777 /ORGANISM="Proboscia alata, Strain PI-D3" /LENGTH=344 /DNA_ID=CAMNT_0039122291 /DNA_START=100 /DNA_END=1134 /DNA_ORIENTATION=+